MQGGCQIEETKKYGPSERTDQTPEKELSDTDIANLSDAELKSLVIRMLREMGKQPSPNYKRRVYSDHMEGTSCVRSLSDRGGCATGPYKTPTVLNHAAKTGSHRALPST